MKILYKKLIKQKKDLSKAEVFFVMLFRDKMKSMASSKEVDQVKGQIEKDRRKSELKANRETVIQDQKSDRELKHKEKMDLKNKQIEIQKSKLELMKPVEKIKECIKKTISNAKVYRENIFDRIAERYFKDMN